MRMNLLIVLIVIGFVSINTLIFIVFGGEASLLCLLTVFVWGVTVTERRFGRRPAPGFIVGSIVLGLGIALRLIKVNKSISTGVIVFGGLVLLVTFLLIGRELEKESKRIRRDGS